MITTDRDAIINALNLVAFGPRFQGEPAYPNLNRHVRDYLTEYQAQQRLTGIRTEGAVREHIDQLLAAARDHLREALPLPADLVDLGALVAFYNACGVDIVAYEAGVIVKAIRAIDDRPSRVADEKLHLSV